MCLRADHRRLHLGDPLDGGVCRVRGDLPRASPQSRCAGPRGMSLPALSPPAPLSRPVAGAVCARHPARSRPRPLCARVRAHRRGGQGQRVRCREERRQRCVGRVVDEEEHEHSASPTRTTDALLITARGRRSAADDCPRRGEGCRQQPCQQARSVRARGGAGGAHSHSLPLRCCCCSPPWSSASWACGRCCCCGLCSSSWTRRVRARTPRRGRLKSAFSQPAPPRCAGVEPSCCPTAAACTCSS